MQDLQIGLLVYVSKYLLEVHVPKLLDPKIFVHK